MPVHQRASAVGSSSWDIVKGLRRQCTKLQRPSAARLDETGSVEASFMLGRVCTEAGDYAAAFDELEQRLQALEAEAAAHDAAP